MKNRTLTGGRLAYPLFLVTSSFSLSWFDFKPIDYADMSLGTTLGHQTPAGLWALIVYTLYGINPHVYPGVPASAAGLSYLVILNAAHIVLPLWASQFVYVYVSLFIAQCGVYSLVKWVFARTNTESTWAALLGAVFYAYGPYYQFYAGDGAIVILSFYAAFPWLMFFGLRAAESFGHSVKDYTGSLLGLALSAFYGSAGFTYYYHITGLGAILFAVVSYALFRKGVREKLLAVAGFVVAVIVLELSQLYVIAPYFSAGPALAQAGTSSPSLIGLLSGTSQLTDYLVQLTFSYFPAPQPWYPLHTNIPPILHTPLWGLGVLVLILYPFFYRRLGRTRQLLPFYALLFASVVLGAGTNFPFGRAVAALFDAFWPVRAISVTFTSLQYIEQLAFAVLIAGSVTLLLKTEKMTRRTAVYLEAGVVCALAVIAPYAAGLPRGVTLTYSHLPPNETGDRFFTINETVSIPAYYRKMVTYVNSLPARGAVLSLPIVGNFHASTWYISVDNLAGALNKPVAGGGYIMAPELSYLVNTLAAWQQGLVPDVNLSTLLSLEGIGYIVVQGDTLQGPYYSGSPPFNISFIEDSLNRSQGIVQLARFGPDVVYGVEGYTGKWQQGTPVEWLGVLLASVHNLTLNESLAEFRPRLTGISPECQVYANGSSLVFASSVVAKTCTLNYTLPYALPLYLSADYTAQPNSTLLVSAGTENSATFTLSQKGNITWEFYPRGKSVTLEITAIPVDVYSHGDVLYVSDLSVSYFLASPGIYSVTSLGLIGPIKDEENLTYVFGNLGRVLHYTENCGLLNCEIVADTTEPSILEVYGPAAPYVTIVIHQDGTTRTSPFLEPPYGSLIGAGNVTASIGARDPNALNETVSAVVFVALILCYLASQVADRKLATHNLELAKRKEKRPE